MIILSPSISGTKSRMPNPYFKCGERRRQKVQQADQSSSWRVKTPQKSMAADSWVSFRSKDERLLSKVKAFAKDLNARNLAWDRCKRSLSACRRSPKISSLDLHKIPVEDLFTRPLHKNHERDMYRRSLQDMSIQGHCARKLCVRSLCKTLAQDLYTKSFEQMKQPQMITWGSGNFRWSYVFRSCGFLYKTSVQPRKRSLRKISAQAKCILYTYEITHKISPGGPYVLGLFRRSLCKI